MTSKLPLRKAKDLPKYAKLGLVNLQANRSFRKLPSQISIRLGSFLKNLYFQFFKNFPTNFVRNMSNLERAMCWLLFGRMQNPTL